VQTYPTWPVGNPPVLDSIAECAKLPVADRLELRQAMSAFVAQANARSQGG
jgi:hypothetical protein